MPHRCRGAPLKLCLVGDFYLVLRLGELNELVAVAKSRFQCAGINRHEVKNERVLQERSSEPPGPESCAATARDPAKRRQGIGGGGRSSLEKMQSGRRRLCNARKAT